MSTTAKTHIPLLGTLATAAGLISDGQLQIAVYEKQLRSEMLLGEILAAHGWLKQETADFLSLYVQNPEWEHHSRLGEYLEKAGLLTEEQVLQIIREQAFNHIRFGAIAVLKGYISQKTLDFFVLHFCPEENTGNFRHHHLLQRSEKVTQPSAPPVPETVATAKSPQGTKIDDLELTADDGKDDDWDRFEIKWID